MAVALPQILTDGTHTHIYGLDRLASVDGSGTRTWEIHDALGSVRQHLAADGSVLPGGSYAYTPFGVVASGNTPAPFGFTGELHSQGLVYLRARWYDPSSGAFTARDPFAGFPETPYSLHPYQYGYSNPLLYTDASGKYSTTTPTPEPSSRHWDEYPEYVNKMSMKHKVTVPGNATFYTHAEARALQKDVLAGAVLALEEQAKSERDAFVCILTLIAIAAGPAGGSVAAGTGATMTAAGEVAIVAEVAATSAVAITQLKGNSHFVSAKTKEGIEVIGFIHSHVDNFVKAAGQSHIIRRAA